MTEYKPEVIEKKWQQKWADNKIYEANIDHSRNKFMTTFPIAYLNGSLHAGHGYTSMKVDAYARFKRMLGYNVLFSQGWHATGQPIQGVAERLKKNDAVQKRILKQSGITEEELEKFTDPLHIANYYKRHAKRDFSRLGISIDWRREFVTTTLCPPFSRFIEWQYETLRDLGYVKKGTHPVIWCSHCQSPTGDHDRLEGEGVSPVKFTLLKFAYNDSYLVPATLRPETIFGVTNMWIHPHGDYVEVLIDGEKWYVSEPTVIKLEDQLHDIEVLRKLKGKEFIGKTCHCPLRDEKIKILPATFISVEHTTGVVMSVPSHAPYDYVALRDLKQNPEFLQNYDLSPDFVDDIELIAMIKTPGLGKHPAKEIIEEMDIENQDDVRIEEATQEIYKKEYHSGVMLENCGKYAGTKVSEIKDILITDLREDNLSSSLWEPAEPVICRCSTKNHVKILKDQWFIEYSNPKWKQQVHEHLNNNMTIFPPKAKQAFEYTIDWLDDKACARKSGLGTPLPWDPEWIVETLSDSTIYMAYYTIARIINNHELSAEQLPNELFDYLFRDAATLKKAVKKSGLEKKLVKEMKEEFEYFYPPDFRASAKELVYNHLTFYIFQHLAIFPANHYPLEIEANGMIMIEGDKMSKSAGNSVTLKELMDKFGVDPTRFALAYCGEGIADASFRYADAEAVKKRLKSIYHELTTTKFAKEEQKIDKWIISRLQQKIRETKDHYANLRTRSAISTGFFDILNDLKWYETRSKYRKGPGYKKALVTLVDLMTPIIPHFAEEINDVLNRGESYAVLRSFPRPLKTKENQRIEQQETYVKNVKDDISGILNAIKKQETKDIKSIQIFITPRWKYQILQLYKQKPKNLIKEAMQKESIRKHGNEAVKYAKKLLKNPGITSFDLTPRSESSAIKDAIDYLKQEFSVEEIKVISALKSNHQKAKIAEPGRPGIALNFE